MEQKPNILVPCCGNIVGRAPPAEMRLGTTQNACFLPATLRRAEPGLPNDGYTWGTTDRPLMTR